MSHTTVETNEWNHLAFKFDYRRSETDGWQDNPWQGPEKGANDFAREKQDSYRVAARWTPTSSFTADYAFDRTQLWYVQSYNHVIIGSNVPALAPFIAPFVHDDRQREAPAPGLYAPISTNEANGHFLNLSWTPVDNVTVKSITAYREFEVLSNALNGFGIASPGSGPFAGQLLGGQNTIENTHQRQFSQEFLLSGNVERLEYTVGAIYFSEDASNTNWSRFTMRTPFTSVNWQPFDPQLQTPKTITGVKLKSWGAFGQATWTPPILDDRLALTAGVRYSHDNKDLLRTQLLDNPVHLPIENNVSRVDPAFTVNYKWTDNLSTYVRWATGYRGGGASVRELPAPSLDPNDTGFNEFDIEKVEATEVGLKSDFWDGRARLNAALFYQKYKDKQVSFQKDSVSNTRVFNINKPVKLKGGEAEFTLVPVDGLTLSASATYMENNIDSVFNPTSGIEEPFRMALMPKWAWATSADYLFPFQPLGGELNLFVGLTGSLDYCFNERSCFGSFEKLRGGSRNTSGEPNSLLDARLTLTMPDFANGTLKLGLWGKNLLDRKYYHFGFSVPGLNTGIINYGDPRTYGVSASYEFGGRR